MQKKVPVSLFMLIYGSKTIVLSCDLKKKKKCKWNFGECRHKNVRNLGELIICFDDTETTYKVKYFCRAFDFATGYLNEAKQKEHF